MLSRKNRSLWCAFLCASLCGGLVTAHADSQPLEEVVVWGDSSSPYYAGGYLSEKTSVGLFSNQDVMDVPFTAMSITSKTISDFALPGNDQMMDLLSFSPSVRKTTSADLVAIRGKQVQASKMNINGIPGMYSNFSMGTNFLEAVDILSGPAQAYAGSSTENVIGGLVNLRPKKATDTPLNDVGVRFAGKSNFQETIDVSRRFGEDNKWGIRVNALNSSGDLAVHGEKLKQQNIFVNLDRRSDRSTTNLLIGYAYSKHNGGHTIFQTIDSKYIPPDISPSSPASPLTYVPFLPSAPDGSHNVTPSWAYKESRTWLMTLNHEQKVNDHWSAFFNAGIMRNDTPVNFGTSSSNSTGNGIFIFNRDKSFDGAFKRTYTVSASGSTKRYLGAGLKSSYTFGSMKNDLLIGIDRASTVNRSASSKTLGTFIGNLYQDNDWDVPVWQRASTSLSSKYDTTSLTLIDTMKFLDERLLITGGLHYHTYKSRSFKKGAVSDREKYDDMAPTYGFVYKITPNFSVYANHSETFLDGAQVPDDKGYLNGGDLLDPAKTKSNEFGVKIKAGGLLHTLSFYRTEEPSYFAKDNMYSANGEILYKGIEWTTAGSLGDKWDFIASIGFNRFIWQKNSNSALNGLTANGIPKWNGNLALSYKATDQLSLLGRVNYIGTSKIGYGTYSVPAYLRFDLGMKYDTHISDTPVTLSAMCYNVTDRKGWFTADQGNQLLTGDPRTFMVSAEFKL